MKIVYLNEERQHTLTGRIDERMVLNPGRNIVDDKLFDAVIKADKGKNQLTSMIDTGLITVHEEGVDITKMPTKEAISTIELETTADGVQELLDQEQARTTPRDKVIEAATAKIDAIRSAEVAAAEAVTATAKAKAKGGANKS
jgi:hypothetical protein